MGTIVQKVIDAAPGSERLLVLDAREAMIWPFNVGNDWAELRLGFFMSVVPLGNDNAAPVAETINLSAVSDHPFFGIKTNNDSMPRTTGADAWGITTGGTGTVAMSAAGSLSHPNFLNTATLRGTTMNVSGSQGIGNSYGIGSGTQRALNTLYCRFMGLRFQLTNRGGATQTVIVSGTASDVTAEGDPTLARLRARLAAAAWTAPLTQAWHDAGVPRAIPDAVFAYLPFAANRLCIHSWHAEKWA